MDVLEHDPMTLFVTLFNSSFCDLVLALTQRYVEEGFAGFNSESISFFFNNFFDLLDWI